MIVLRRPISLRRSGYAKARGLLWFAIIFDNQSASSALSAVEGSTRGGRNIDVNPCSTPQSL